MPTIRPRAAKATALPPCAVCTAHASNGFWGDRYLCDGCYRAWWVDAPGLTSLELAHADKHPDDVEARGEYQYLGTGQTEKRWVILKDEVGVKVAGDFANAWVQRQVIARRGAA